MGLRDNYFVLKGKRCRLWNGKTPAESDTHKFKGTQLQIRHDVDELRFYNASLSHFSPFFIVYHHKMKRVHQPPGVYGRKTICVLQELERGKGYPKTTSSNISTFLFQCYPFPSIPNGHKLIKTCHFDRMNWQKAQNLLSIAL